MKSISFNHATCTIVSDKVVSPMNHFSPHYHGAAVKDIDFYYILLLFFSKSNICSFFRYINAISINISPSIISRLNIQYPLSCYRMETIYTHLSEYTYIQIVSHQTNSMWRICQNPICIVAMWHCRWYSMCSVKHFETSCLD